MTSEKDLEKLLTLMAPCVFPDEYVFCIVPDGKYGDYFEYCPVASFMESEGLTLVLTRKNTDKAKLQYDSVFKRITLEVHSSLEAVGLTLLLYLVNWLKIASVPMLLRAIFMIMFLFQLKRQSLHSNF